MCSNDAECFQRTICSYSETNSLYNTKSTICCSHVVKSIPYIISPLSLDCSIAYSIHHCKINCHTAKDNNTRLIKNGYDDMIIQYSIIIHTVIGILLLYNDYLLYWSHHYVFRISHCYSNNE